MADTNRQVVSDVKASVRAQGYDDRLSSRFVLSCLRDATKTLLKQDVDSRRLLKVNDIWLPIHCLDMIEDSSHCGGVPNCKTIMKSKKQIPEVFESSYGDLIKVFTVNGEKEYTQIKSFEYSDISNLEYRDSSKKYFWIEDRYLFIPDSDVKKVSLIGLFKNPQEVRFLNGEIGECYKPLDDIFVCPDYLVSIVKEVTERKILGSKAVVKDERPDLNTNNK